MSTKAFSIATLLRVIVVLITVSISVTLLHQPALPSDEANSGSQVATITEFLEKMATDSIPNVSDFFKFFGSSNESELEMILRIQFPKLQAKQIWFSDPKALEYVNRIYQNPGQYSSMFLKCVKEKHFELFCWKTKPEIGLPKRVSKDFKNYTVVFPGKELVFQFVGHETVIENIYFPDGRSIYKLSEECHVSP